VAQASSLWVLVAPRHDLLATNPSRLEACPTQTKLYCYSRTILSTEIPSTGKKKLRFIHLSLDRMGCAELLTLLGKIGKIIC